ncbi:transposase [Nocardia terpenica]|uniref:RNA-guided endonuclease InsQ/TnpB family protein n=1 Tax=Nocardia terpenica TaxID=455432 RepID=UPI002FE17AE3
MLLRYRYRAYPTDQQQMMLTRSFGCARTVFNDALRCRDAAYSAGIRLSDSAIQKQVITDAKRTQERAWLAEVSSVVLVQAVNDARRAYRNWLDSITGQRKGRPMGRPRFKSRKDRRQSIRFTRNGFGITTRGVRLAKIGDVRLRWSRELPAEPSSATLIREADGRYYVSFVVEVVETPLPSSELMSGVDVGLIDLAAIARSDGTREKIVNPRHLRRREHALRRAQRALSRKQKGSRNRVKACVRVAAVHRKVRETRLDHHHKLALRLICDNQAVAVEDLSVVGLTRTWLAKSVCDAGWSLLIRLLEEKAARYGRQVVRVDRWTPTTRTCACCGHVDGAKTLAVRVWTCSVCCTSLDRDYNAAVNILDAAGLAESLNACGADVRLRLAGAVGDEVGTLRTGADRTVSA